MQLIDVKGHLTLNLLYIPLPYTSPVPYDPVSRLWSPISLPLDPLRKPVFGLNLEQLFERDGSAIPMIVYQCIQAVDLFGIDLEDIYGKPGAQSTVNKLRDMFDTGMSRIIK